MNETIAKRPTLVKISKNLELGSLNCQQVIRDTIKNIDAYNPSINAVEPIDRRRLLHEAKLKDMNGDGDGILNGLPIILKSNIDTVGYPTTGSTQALAHHYPRVDATIVSKLKKEGAIIVGKSHMHEIAFGATSNNYYCGSVHNPHSPDRVPGGSSGGTAAAIASGMVPAGLGTDTGGSVRVPAALCGLAGFRPSTGRWPTDGILPISPTRDTAGPMAHCVGDLDLIDRAVTQERSRAAAIPTPLETLRLGVPFKYFWENLDKQVLDATQSAISALEAAGAKLVEVDFSDLCKEVDEIGMVIALQEALASMSSYLEASEAMVSVDDIFNNIRSPDVQNIVSSIRNLSSEDKEHYLKAARASRPKLIKMAMERFKKHTIDATIFPTVPTMAPKIGEDLFFETDHGKLPTFPTLIRNCSFGSVLGLPGITLPNRTLASHLPNGLALDSPLGSDTSLLSIGLSLESLVSN